MFQRMTLSLFSFWQGQITSASVQSLLDQQLQMKCKALALHSMYQGFPWRTCHVTGHCMAMAEYWLRPIRVPLDRTQPQTTATAHFPHRRKTFPRHRGHQGVSTRAC